MTVDAKFSGYSLVSVLASFCLEERDRPRSIYQFSNMAPRLSGLNCTNFLRFILSLNSQKRLEYKKNIT